MTPTKEGFYWARRAHDAGAQVVFVTNPGDGWVAFQTGFEVERPVSDYVWFGERLEAPEDGVA